MRVYHCSIITMRYYVITLLFLLFSPNGASEGGIIAGEEVMPHSRNYMVSLQVGDHHVCGGMLVRKYFVLTAAHCKREGLVAVLGAHDIGIKERTQRRIPVAKYYPHPDYTLSETPWDIMLLKLKTKAVLDKTYVDTIGLPETNIPDNSQCSVAGWGGASPNSADSDVLLKAAVTILQPAMCRRIWNEKFISRQMICTWCSRHKCCISQGDSGGPLVCDGKAYGVVSFIGECSVQPAVYMNLTFFSTWIKDVMKKDKLVT